MRARYYEPGSGRFISEDSSADGRNWYAYCHGDPVNRIDSNGQDVGLVNSIIGEIFKFLKNMGITFSGMAGSELMLKIAGAALTIAGYVQAIRTLQMEALVAQVVADVADVLGCPEVGAAAEAHVAGANVAIGFLKVMCAITMYNLGMEVWLYVANNPDGI